MEHDQRFKDLVVDYPRDALKLFAPQEAHDLPPDAVIRPVRQERLSQRFGEPRRIQDVPLEIEFPSGQREGLAIVVEEETNQRQFNPMRLGHYLLDLARLLNTHRVAATVIYLRGPPPMRRLALGTERRRYLALDWHCCVLPELEAARWEASENLVARLNLLNMQHAADERVRLYAASLEGLLTLEHREDRRDKYADFIDAYACLSEDEMLRFEEEELARRENSRMVGYWETRRRQWAQEGREAGRAEGREAGRAEGREAGRAEERRKSLMTVLQARGFEIPEEVRDRVQGERNLDKLDRWLRRAIVIPSLEGLFRDDA